jgi:hypothetical protein
MMQFTADKAVVASLAKGDKVAANRWLDPDFTWIDSEGLMWAKTDAFRAELKPLVSVGTDTKIIEHNVVRGDWNNSICQSGEGQASNAFLPHSCLWMELDLFRERWFRRYLWPGS